MCTEKRHQQSVIEVNCREQAGSAVVTDKEASLQHFALPRLLPFRNYRKMRQGNDFSFVLLIAFIKTTEQLTFIVDQ